MLPFIGRPQRPKSARSHRNTVSSQRVAQSTIIHSAFLILNLFSTVIRPRSSWTFITRPFRSWLDAGKFTVPR